MRTAQQLEQAFREGLVELRDNHIALGDQFLDLLKETLEVLQYHERELAHYMRTKDRLWAFHEKVEKALGEFEEC